MSQHELTFIIGSYLFGSIPFGFILYYFLERKDIRKEGSGNIGATNVLRTKGRTAGIVILVLDLFKGVIPVIYGLRHFDSPVIVMLGGVAVIMGHLFPLYIKFKGGKGIASLVGVFLAFHYPSALLFGFIFFLLLILTRYVSLASIAGVAAVFFSIMFTHIAEVSTALLLVIILIVAKHYGNIKRLSAGTENKFYWNNNG